MPGKIIKIGNPHYCDLPNLYAWKNRKIAFQGTQWQCDDCNKIYEVVFYRATGLSWKKLDDESSAVNKSFHKPKA